MNTEKLLIETTESPKPIKLKWDLVKDYGRLVIAYYNRPLISEERYVSAISDVSDIPIEQVRFMKKNGNIHELIFNYKKDEPENYSLSLDQFVDLSGQNAQAIEIRSNIDRHMANRSAVADLFLDKLSNLALRGIDLVEVAQTVEQN